MKRFCELLDVFAALGVVGCAIFLVMMLCAILLVLGLVVFGEATLVSFDPGLFLRTSLALLLSAAWLWRSRFSGR